MSEEIRLAASRIAADLKQNGIPESRLEAEVLLRHVLQYDRAQFYASLSESISAERLACARSLVERRITHEPLAYITGHREFYGLDFLVNPAVLIPRQETELLVDVALEFARDRAAGSISAADIGTGSGAIAVAIAANLPNAKVYAVDCSADALAVADCNRRRHGVVDRVSLLQGDLLAPLPRSVDLLVSNPPYVAGELLSTLPLEVRQEPQLALDGGERGLEVISRLLEQAPCKLNAGGRLIVEISPEQVDAAFRMAQTSFPHASVTYRNDLLGLPRCVTISPKK